MNPKTIKALGFDIRVYSKDFENNFISLTDIARYKNADEPRDVVQNWMRNKDTIDFLGLWEELNNPNFNRPDFEAVRKEAGRNAFTILRIIKGLNLMKKIDLDYHGIYKEKFQK